MDILSGFRNTWRGTADPPPPQDNDAGVHGDQVLEDDELDTMQGPEGCMKRVVDFVNRFCSEDTHVLCADGQVIDMRYTVLILCIN